MESVVHSAFAQQLSREVHTFSHLDKATEEAWIRVNNLYLIVQCYMRVHLLLVCGIATSNGHTSYGKWLTTVSQSLHPKHFRTLKCLLFVFSNGTMHLFTDDNIPLYDRAMNTICR